MIDLLKAGVLLAFVPRPGRAAASVVSLEGSEVTQAAPGPAAVVPIERKEKALGPQLPPAVGAKRFLQWLQEQIELWDGLMPRDLPWTNGPTYPYRDPIRPGTETGIWQLYLMHCREDNLTPLPDNRLAEAFGKIACKRLVPDRSTGKRRRLTVYRIEPAKRKRRA